MCKPSLSDYSYAYILVKVTIPVAAATFAASNNDNKKLVFKNCAPFTDCKKQNKQYKNK